MRLQELIIKVKEQNLSREQLEDYREELSSLYAQLQLEKGEIEKEEALFMMTNAEKSVAQRKIEWKGTPKGQRLITIKSYCLAVKELLNSLKSRLFSLY